MNLRNPNQILTAEEYLDKKNVKAVLNRIVMSLLETRPENIELHIVNLLSTASKVNQTQESFPSYNRHGIYATSTNAIDPLAAPKSGGRRQSAISPHLLREASQGGIKRRHVISSTFTSSTKVEIKEIPKDEETYNSLLATTRKVDLFDFLNEDQRRSLVSAMFKKEYHDGDVIIKEGDAPDNFYIIEKGKAIIYKKNQEGENKVVAHSSAGQYFGELALISGSTRAATVIADGDVTCWAIDQTTYLYLLREQHGKKRQLYRQLLKNIKLLKVLSDYEILLVADALQETTTKPNEVIVKQGDQGDEFFIILKGQCKVLKTEPGQTEPKEVAELKSGDYFGEVALLQNTPRTATIVADGEVKLIKLDRKSFTRLLGPCANIFKENMKHYSNNNEEEKNE